ncbi:MAG: sulfur carrier protein ThiS [Verrucomicrobiota bacterium]
MSEGAKILIYINGRSRLISAEMNLICLLDTLQMPSDSVTIEHNGELILQKKFATTFCKNGDTLNLIRVISGN